MPFFALAYVVLSPPVEENYLGLYLQGQKIGYVASKAAPGRLDMPVIQTRHPAIAIKIYMLYCKPSPLFSAKR